MLNIEKVIKLLDEHRLQTFRSYLRSIRAVYPLRLIDAISRDILTEQDSDQLCHAVYGEGIKQAKQKFFQLAHHSFRLTAHINKNASGYLVANIVRVQDYYNTGDRIRANKLGTILLDVAEKVNDYTSLTAIYGILAQEAYILEDFNRAMELHEANHRILEVSRNIQQIYTVLRSHYVAKSKPLNDAEFAADIKLFQTHIDSEDIPLRIISLYAYCFSLQHVNSPLFYNKETVAKLFLLEQEYYKYEYCVLPFLEDFEYKISYLKIRYLMTQSKMGSILEESQSMLERSQNHLCWESFINVPMLYSIAVQASYYSTFHFTAYRTTHQEEMTDSLRTDLLHLQVKCETLLEHPVWDNKLFLIKQINLRTIYAGILLIEGSPENLRKGASIMEETLVSFQQIPFHAFLDGMFTTLILCYFCLGEYDKVATNYKRYRKVTEGKSINLENDVTLHGFYYISQWLSSGRKQYLLKIEGLIKTHQESNFHSTLKLLRNVVRYFDIPIKGE